MQYPRRRVGARPPSGYAGRVIPRIVLGFFLIVGLVSLSCTDDDSGGASGAAATSEARGATPEASRPAVILVHGWAGSPREMSPLKSFLDANGYRAFIAILPGDDNVANAEYLRDFVAEVEELAHVEQVDVVGFSMGGLSLRYYIRFLGGGSEVSRYVSIDSPQHGDAAACLLPPESGGQMCPFGEFMSKLNQGDDTPGDVRYTTILNRRSSALLGRLRDGAREITVDGEHNELPSDPAVHQAVLDGLKN